MWKRIKKRIKRALPKKKSSQETISFEHENVRFTVTIKVADAYPEYMRNELDQEIIDQMIHSIKDANINYIKSQVIVREKAWARVPRP